MLESFPAAVDEVGADVIANHYSGEHHFVDAILTAYPFDQFPLSFASSVCSLQIFEVSEPEIMMRLVESEGNRRVEMEP